ncbi:tetratricopeptide repeat-containing sensor histidine kinase [Aureivirga marina]|uniref:tetratricopeptide repeat-containing sensor histidine kinase n=1 Tax=Aureivirga marina TaxID=1182451 RepID=UPI0018C96954|nr:tetratricopeptide repeat protein [Aureivirga marina]
MKLFTYIIITLFSSFNYYCFSEVKFNDFTEEFQEKDSIQIQQQEKIKNLLVYLHKRIKINDTKLINETYDSIVTILSENKLYKKTIYYLKESEKFAQTDLRRGDLKFRIGSHFFRLEEYDSAKVYFNKALEIFPKNAKKGRAMTYNNYGAIEYYSGNFNQAANFFEEARKLQNELGNVIIEMTILNNLGGLYHINKQFNKAISSYEKSLRILDSLPDLDHHSLKTKYTVYFNISDAYAAKKDFEKAFHFKNAYLELKESTDQKIRTQEISEIENKYKAEKNKSLIELEKNKRLKAQYISAISLIGVIVICIILWGIVYNRKLKSRNEALRNSRERLKQRNKQGQLEKQKVVQIASTTIDKKEAERKIIAQTLHDSVSALLSSANLHLMASKSQMKDEIPLEILKTQEIIEEASEKISNLSHNIFSAVLINFGLNEAIQDLTEKYSNKNLEITYDSSINARYSQSFEIKLYHIIEELLENIKQHSDANHALVTVREVDSNLEFKISDDGKGFEKDDIKDKEGLGLSQIHLRIKAMQGIMAINSEKDSGTVVYISVPIVRKQEVSNFM